MNLSPTHKKLDHTLRASPIYTRSPTIKTDYTSLSKNSTNFENRPKFQTVHQKIIEVKQITPKFLGNLNSPDHKKITKKHKENSIGAKKSQKSQRKLNNGLACLPPSKNLIIMDTPFTSSISRPDLSPQAKKIENLNQKKFEKFRSLADCYESSIRSNSFNGIKRCDSKGILKKRDLSMFEKNRKGKLKKKVTFSSKKKVAIYKVSKREKSYKRGKSLGSRQLRLRK